MNRVAHDQYVGFKAGADWGHARALKEIGAEVARLQGEIVKRNQYKLNEQSWRYSGALESAGRLHPQLTLDLDESIR